MAKDKKWLKNFLFLWRKGLVSDRAVYIALGIK